jgi:hypothetical protein
LANTNYKQGIYKLKNPKKYKGDPYNVIYRSSWELRAFKWLDSNPNVIEWGSEELVINYISPIDNRNHRYFPDLIVKVRKFDGSIVTYVIEIKPYAQTVEPKPKKRVTKSYINEVCTWGINTAKWAAAKEYCRHRDWEFKLLTERELFNG